MKYIITESQYRILTEDEDYDLRQELYHHISHFWTDNSLPMMRRLNIIVDTTIEVMENYNPSDYELEDYCDKILAGIWRNYPDDSMDKDELFNKIVPPVRDFLIDYWWDVS